MQKKQLLIIRKLNGKKVLNKKKNHFLTPNEYEILLLIYGGLNNHEIGSKLKVSKRTVDSHRANIYKKAKSKNIIDLIKWGHKQKIVVFKINNPEIRYIKRPLS